MCGWVKGNFQCTNLMLPYEVMLRPSCTPASCVVTKNDTKHFVY